MLQPSKGTTGRCSIKFKGNDVASGRRFMGYQDYLTSHTPTGEDVLSEWRWLIGHRVVLWHVTLAGDAILRDPYDGTIHLLDVTAGRVDFIARDEDEFEFFISRPAQADQWLRRELVDACTAAGRRPGLDECLVFNHPPVLGGAVVAENTDLGTVEPHFIRTGQIHQQVNALQPRTVAVPEPVAELPKPWWRFW